MAAIVKPPAPIPWETSEPKVFLAGSIDMGRAEPWQAIMEQTLADSRCIILNPRREEWDETWVQSLHNDQFRQQVEWELAAQEQAELIAMYFAPSTRAPVTLLELGLFARTGKLAVCCPEGFWRKGNVDVICHRYGVPVVADVPALARWVLNKLKG
jgi:hypothetical protein